MPAAQHIQLSQERESQVEVRQDPRLGYRYSYARSADTQSSGDRGQDYVTLITDETRIAFALCDGVSQSFVGDLAARILGDALLDWLWTKLDLNQTEAVSAAGLRAYLHQLTERATKDVKAYVLSPEILPIVRGVLEQKRALGSESTFVSGLIDTDTGQLFLAWMGDSRLRLWGPEGERVDQFAPNTFQTRERWSSRDGLVGDLHIARLALQGITNLAAYSDGLAVLEDQVIPALSEKEVDEIIAMTGQNPKSDDVSFIEIWLGQRRPTTGLLTAPAGLKIRLKDNGIVVMSWEPVTGAEGYEIQLSNQPDLIKVSGVRWAIPLEQLLSERQECRVRARRGAVGGPWSEPIQLPKSGTEPIGALSAPEIISQTPPGVQSKPAQWLWPAFIIGGALLVIYLVGGGVGAWVVGNGLWNIFGTTPTSAIPVEPTTHTPTPTLTPTDTATATPTPTTTLTDAATTTPTSTLTPTGTVTATPTPTTTLTDAATATSTPTLTPTDTATATLTSTLTLTVTATQATSLSPSPSP